MVNNLIPAEENRPAGRVFPRPTGLFSDTMILCWKYFEGTPEGMAPTSCGEMKTRREPKIEQKKDT